MPAHLAALTAQALEMLKSITNLLSSIFTRSVPVHSAGVPRCPLCSHTFDRWPSRRRKCPKCSATVIVRTIDKKKTLVTEGHASEIDKQRSQRAYRNKLVDILVMSQCSEDEYRYMRKAIDGADARRQDLRDVASRLLNQMVVLKAGDNDYHGLANVYHAMAWLAHLHGDDPADIVADKIQAQLRDLQMSGWKRVTAYSACECSTCSQVSGQEQSIKQAIAHPLLPVRSCQTGRTIICYYRGAVHKEEMEP